MITLGLGVIALTAISWWRLSDHPAAPPSRPEGAPASPAQIEPTADPDPVSGVVTFGGQTMGTTYTVKYVPPHRGILGMPEAVTESALVAVNESMSTYDPNSEISKFNAVLPDQRVPLSPEFLEVLVLSQRIHDQSNGAFDITVGPLVNLYGFGAAAQDEPPSERQLKSVSERVGMKWLELDVEARTLEKLREGVELDMGAIAKGYGVDQVARALEKLQITQYMVEVGGEIRIRGKKKDGAPWRLAIESPTRGERRIHATLSLPESGAALATSGDYRNFREIDGKVVSHTFDPRTSRPTPRRTASVSVVRPTAAEADGLATALSVLTPDEAIDLANQHGWAALLLVHSDSGGDFSEKKSRAFEEIDFEMVRN